MSGGPVPVLHPEALRAELERVAGSADFARAPVLRRLLLFLGGETLAGRGHLLKAYSVAVDGLGRDADFDPQVDSYPRVQAGRLRRMLDAFYAASGEATVRPGYRLAIPRGGYSVTWEALAHAHAAGPAPVAALDAGLSVPQSPIPDYDDDGDASPPGKWLRIGALALVLIAATLFSFWVAGRFQSGTDAEARAQMGATVYLVTGDGGSALRTDRATMVLETGLVRFPRVDVIRTDQASVPQDLAVGDYVLTLVDRPSGDNVVIDLRLEDERHRSIWTDHIEAAPRSEAVLVELREAVVAIARPFGVIANHDRSREDGQFTPGYRCLLQFDVYRRLRPRSLEAPVEKCLGRSMEMFPTSAEVLQAAATFYFVRNDGVDIGADGRKARELARAALRYGPDNPGANLAMGRAAILDGECAQGIGYAQRAVDLNPIDPDNLSTLGLYLASCRRLDEASQRLAEAYALDPARPTAQMASRILVEVQRGENALALELAERMLPDRSNGEDATYNLGMALALAANGRGEAAQRHWVELARIQQMDPYADPDRVLKRFILAPQSRQAYVAVLRRSGALAPS